MRLSTHYTRGARQALRNAAECRVDAQAEHMQHLLIFARRDRQYAVEILEMLSHAYSQEGKHPLAQRVTELVIKKQRAAIKAETEDAESSKERPAKIA